MKYLLIIPLILFSFDIAQARKITMKDLGGSAFFRFTGGMQNTGKSFYDQSSGSSTFFTDDVPYNYSGELGFQYSFSPMYAVRIGAEFAQSQETKVDGKNASGTKLMTVDSSAISFNPNLVFEITTKVGPWYKAFIYLGAGFANLKVTNDYKLTSDGNTAYPGVSDFKESVEGSGMFYNAGVAFQVLTVDNISTIFELGYRELHVTNLEYGESGTNFQGAYTEGGTALASDGTKRQAKIAGPYVGITLRFHFPQFM